MDNGGYRPHRESDPVVSGHGWILSCQSRELLSPVKERISFIFKEYQVLLQLATAEGEVKDRLEMLSYFGYPDNRNGYKALESVVYRIRKKAERLGFCLIKTAQGNGWSLTVPVTVV